MATTAQALTRKQRELFERPNFAHVATICPDLRPHVSPVWIDVDEEGRILVNTARGRVKERNMRREPRVAVSVFDMDDPYKMVAVQGHVVDILEGPPAEDHIDALSRKYIGSDYSRHGDRVLFVIEPDDIGTMGL